MLTKSFELLIQNNLPFVKACLEGICHEEKNKAEKFLALMNVLLDFYLLRPNEEDAPCFTHIYIPKCPEWAEDVFFEFLTIKLAVSNSTLYNELKKTGNNVSYTQSGKALTREKEKRSFFKNLTKKLEICHDYLESQYGCFGKSFIYYQKNRFNRYKALQKHFSDFIDEFPTKKIAVSSNAIKKIKEKAKSCHNTGLLTPGLDNIIIFNSRSKESKSYTKSEIDKLNQLKVGVKKIIVFDFSSKPFILNNLFEKRNALASQYAQCKGDEVEYISFSKDEINYLFDNYDSIERIECGNEETFDLFDNLVSEIVDNVEYPIKNRNKLATCFNTNLINSLLDENVGLREVDDTESLFISLQQNWKSVLPRLKDFVNKQEIAIVFLNSQEPYAKSVQNFMKEQLGCEVFLYSIRDLKKGNVNQEKIIFLQYCPHNANSPFARWPNSFDDIPIKPEQKILILIQKSVFQDKYEWDLYEYKKLLNRVLNSKFRQEYFCESLEQEIKPSHRKINLTDFDDFDGGAPTNYNYQVITEKWEKNFYGTEYLLIYDEKTEAESFQQVRTIYEKGEDIYGYYEARPLDEIVKYISEIANEKVNKETENENIFIKKYMSQFNINASYKMELWREILKKKIEDDGKDVVYDNILRMVQVDNPRDSFIKKVRFFSWIDPNVELVLPRKRRHQVALWNYLSLSIPYLNFVRNRMRRQKGNSKERNRILMDFIVHYFLANAKENYEDFQANDDYLAYLPLNEDEFSELLKALSDEICKEDKWAIITEIKK